MLMPLGDDNSDRVLTPYVTYTLVVLNVLVFVLLQQMGNNPFTYAWSYVPMEITRGQDLIGTFRVGNGQVRLFDSPSPIYLTLISAMFMHGDFMHLGGNMLYLWIFGDNVEDRMGHAKFLTFYLVAGLLASVAQIAVGPKSIIPNLGASGAIAGVLGAYLILFPKKGIRVMMGYSVTMVPAIVVVGLWGLMQLIGGFGQLGREGGGVAYMAHVGCFIAGMVLVFIFRNSVRSMPDSYAARHFQHSDHYE
jgi:membrane associated rhomboid family serine protease